MEGQYCLYKHTAPNGKVYIGITRRTPQRRWRKGGTGYITSPHFYSAIKKYGWDNISHEILYTGLNKEDACRLEKEYIAKYRSNEREFGYNETSGGDTGSVLTESARLRMSEVMKRRYDDPKEREKARYNRLGAHVSPETREKISAAQRGRRRVWTDEHKKNQAEAIKKLYSDPDYMKKAIEQGKSIAIYGLMKSVAVCQCDEHGNVIAQYSSMKEAGRATGIRDGNISKCCRGKAKRAGGYYWRISQVEISSAEKSIN